MMTNPAPPILQVVLGASGAVGSALMGELARQGLPARAVSRTRPADLPAGTGWLAADLSSAPSVERAVQGAGVAYMAAQPEYTRWALDFPPPGPMSCPFERGHWPVP